MKILDYTGEPSEQSSLNSNSREGQLYTTLPLLSKEVKQPYHCIKAHNK